MKKTIWMLLAALLLLPAGSIAEGLPGFEQALEAALDAQQPAVTPEPMGPMFRTPTEDGKEAPAAAAPDAAAEDGASDAQEDETSDGAQENEEAAMSPAVDAADAKDADTKDADASDTAAQDLTLSIRAQAERLEEGHSLTLTVTAQNPMTRDVPVTLTLKLPERLACAQQTVWEAVLPAARADETGRLTPTETAFVREVTLTAGGSDEQAEIVAELDMGTRFYRAQTALALCVPNVTVSARTEGTQGGRVQPGEAFAYKLDVSNSGSASRDVLLEMILPDGVTAGELPAGFSLKNRTLTGTVHAEAARQAGNASVASLASVLLPMTVDEDALEGDEDALRLLSGVLRADGKRVALPRVQACAAQITAKLIPEADSLPVGAEMDLSIAVANTGLAPADVRVSCLLPEGLTLAEVREEGATPDEAGAVPPTDDGSSPQAGVMLTEEAEMPVAEYAPENGTLVYAVHMDAARETADGVAASTRVLTVRVRAEEPQEALREKLLGTALSYQVDGGTRLAEAVAVRVYTPAFLGITRDEWGGIFWAAVLLIVTVTCLYAAVRSDDEEDVVLD